MFIKTAPGAVIFITCFALSSCGGSGGGGGGGNGGGNDDTTPPSGYSVSITTDPINGSNETAVAFNVSGAEVGATYEYSLTLGSSELDGNGSVTQATFDISGLDLSGFPSGTVELDLRLTDSSGNEGISASDSAQKTSEPSAVVLSGTVTYDFVPHEPVSNSGFGLDYNAVEERPVRGATLQILDSVGAPIATTETDENGQYSVPLDTNQDVRVRVRAELFRDGSPAWDFSVTDNTNGNAIYVLDGSLSAIGVENQTRDLHAPSGWDGTSYTSERAAAPFAILDTVYQIVERFVEIDPDIQFPQAEFRWSENNVPETGDLEAGQITTSSYRSNGVTGNVYILGAEDVDTDEYDPHVIVHEWGHYFEDRLSRSDSVGGAHDFDARLDMRVAFGEGWGNALSAMILDDSLYIDTGGVAQGLAGGFDVELNEGFSSPSLNFDPAIGWYSEFSVQSILYDLYDTNNEDQDTVSLGLEPIYDVLTDQDYREQGTVTAIFSFLTQLRDDNAGEVAGIDALASAQDISGTGYEGIGETNDAGLGDVLPIYRSATVNGVSVEVCTGNSLGEYNRLGNRHFVLTTLPSAGTYTFNASRSSGLADADPEIRIIGPLQSFDGRVIRFTCGDSETGTTETTSCSGLLAADHVLEVFDAGNVDDLDDPDNTGGAVCFDVSVTD